MDITRKNFEDINTVEDISMNNLNTTVANVIDNDMLYILSILEQIDKTVGKTFGPHSGYVASELISKRTNVREMKYTKDGQSTLEAMNFQIPTDLMIANEVTKLTLAIKAKSGDGSTTAVRLLYNLVKSSARDIRDHIENIYDYRITTPKVIKLLLDLIKEEVENSKVKSTNYDDIRQIGYISLNCDDDLVKPIEELTEHLKSEKTPLDENFLLMSSVSNEIEETKLIKRPGYRLSVKEFSLDKLVREVEDVKLIFIPNVIDLKLQIIIEELHNFAQTNAFKNKAGKAQKIIYVVSEIDPTVIDLLNKHANTLWETQLRNGETDENKRHDVLNYDFIELDSLREFTKDKREDLCLLLNTQEIYLNDYIELRHEVPEYEDENGNIIKGDKYDNINNRNLWKFKMLATEKEIVKDDGTKVKVTERDHDSIKRDFIKALSTQMLNSTSVNISYTSGDDSLSVTLNEEVTPTNQFLNHLEKLSKVAAAEDKVAANRAKVRLNNLNNKYFLIEIAANGADTARLNMAYRDACMAINSSVRSGFHMGGSVSIYFAVLRVENKVRTLLQNARTERDKIKYETGMFILSKLRESYINIIRGLVPKNISNNVTDLFTSGYIDISTFKFGDTVVISPVETDIETIKGALALFSSFFSSLAIEFSDANSALHAQNITDQVKKKLNEREKRNLSVTEETEEVEEKSEEEIFAEKQFAQAEKEMNERKASMLPLSMANNVRPLNEDFAPRRDKTDYINSIVDRYKPKQLGENVTIEGYDGSLDELSRDIEYEKEKQAEKRRRIAALNQAMITGGNNGFKR